MVRWLQHEVATHTREGMETIHALTAEHGPTLCGLFLGRTTSTREGEDSEVTCPSCREALGLPAIPSVAPDPESGAGP